MRREYLFWSVRRPTKETPILQISADDVRFFECGEASYINSPLFDIEEQKYFGNPASPYAKIRSKIVS